MTNLKINPEARKTLQQTGLGIAEEKETEEIYNEETAGCQRPTDRRFLTVGYSLTSDHSSFVILSTLVIQ